MLDRMINRLLGAIGGCVLGFYLVAVFVLVANFPFSLLQGLAVGILVAVGVGILGLIYPSRLAPFSFLLTIIQDEDMPLNDPKSIFTGISILGLVVGLLCMFLGLIFRTQFIGIFGVLLTLGFVKLALFNRQRLEHLD